MEIDKSQLNAEALQFNETTFGPQKLPALLHWLAVVERTIEVLDAAILTALIPSLHATFSRLLIPSASLQNVTTPTPHPKPGRPIRQSIARCIIKLHSKCESRQLFDFVQCLMKYVVEGNGVLGKSNAGESVFKVACWYNIGEIMESLGSNMMSFMSEIAVTAIKLIRTQNQAVILRYHAVSALTKSLHSAGKAVPDVIAKDLLKHLRTGLSDGADALKRASADALIALSQCTSMISSLQEIDTVVALGIKALERADLPTRIPISRMTAHFLAATQDPAAIIAPQPVKGKKPIPGAEETDDPVTIVTSAADTAAKTMLSVSDMLKVLSSAYNRPNQGRRTRNALIGVYAALLEKLGPSFAEKNYGEIVRHLMTEIVSPSRNRITRREILSTRELVGLLLRDLVGARLLSEQGQNNAIQELVASYLNLWSAVSPGQAEANELILVIALREIAGLIDQLGMASPALQEVLQEPLLRLLVHPSLAVQTHTAWCLRMYAKNTPLRLPKLINAIFDALEKDLAMLGTPASPSELQARCIGRALALAALIATVPERPLYVSYEVSTKIMEMSVQLLKRAGGHEISIAATEAQVAWTLISALLSLGPGFVKLHLSQMLILWRNALPRPTSKDISISERGEADWACLLAVRESALTAILSFLKGSGRDLATLDVARRISSLLTNSLNFVNGFSAAYAEHLREEQQRNSVDHPVAISTSRYRLADQEHRLRRRIFQCFKQLGHSSATESVQPSLVQAAVSVLAEPENALTGAAATQAATQATFAPFTSVWEALDGYGYGVTSLDLDAPDQANKPTVMIRADDTLEIRIESQLSRPALTSMENDTLKVCLARGDSNQPEFAGDAPDPATALVDAAVELFGTLLPLQSVGAIMQGVTLLNNHLRSPKMERNPGRRQACFFNVILSISRALQAAEKAGIRKTRDSVGHPSVTALLRTLLQEAALAEDRRMRKHAAEGFGALCSIAGGSFVSTQCQWLVDQIVTARSAEGRSGCADALAAIYCHIGGISAGSLLKTAENVLTSLVTDPHPIVHYSAVCALAQVAESAGLAYSPFVQRTLTTLADVYNSEAHEPEGGSLGSANLRGAWPLYPEVCRWLSTCIGVLGPDIREAGIAKDLASDLEREFAMEADEKVSVEAMDCLQQFLMFAPAAVDIPPLVLTFRSHLGSRIRRLRIAAITALYQIVQRDALLMSRLGGNQLVEDLFSLLDDDPSLEAVKKVIISWLQQTAAGNPCGWIDLCQRVLQRSRLAKGRASVTPDHGGFQDDEGQSLGAAITTVEAAVATRWRTQLFALRCAHEVIRSVASSGRPEHFDAALGKQLNINSKLLLVSRISDLIRMAFSASTAQTEDVRLAGLEVLRDVVQTFARSPDPDFPGAPLLEQHQAPIAAALTPSFSADAAPEVLAVAIQVCASFIGSGVVQEAAKMGRILKLMTGALLRCGSGAETVTGEAEALSTNAFIMVKIATLAAWAELQAAAAEQSYLDEVISPQAGILHPLWLGTLKDYALIRTDPETSALSSVGGSLDLAQSGIGRETLLPYYEQASLPILAAIAAALSQKSASMTAAMSDIGDLPPIRSEFSNSDMGTAPVANFFVVYGLAFELLSTDADDHRAIDAARTALIAMAALVDTSFSGTAIFASTMFDELCTLCYRIALIGSALVRAEMLAVMEAFVSSRGTSCDLEQARRILAVVTFTLKSSIGSAVAASTFLREDTVDDRALCLSRAFASFATIAKHMERTERFPLMLVALQLFTELVGSEDSQAAYVGQVLPALKHLLDQALSAAPDTAIFGRAVHALLSTVLNNLDTLRNRQGSTVDERVKTNMLMLVLILTATPNGVPISRLVIEQVCSVLGQRARDASTISAVAMQCIRALLVAGSRGVIALQYTATQLLPQVIHIIASIAEHADTAEQGLALVEGSEEAMRTLTAFANAADEDQKPRIYAILLPTLLLLLDPDTESPLHMATVRCLLGLVTATPQAFKEAMVAVPGPARDTLETSMRRVLSSRQNNATSSSKAKSQISLKTFG